MLISGKTDLKIKTVTRDKEGPYIMIKGSSGFSDSSAGKESTCKAEEPSSIPGSGRSAGKGIGYPVQYSWAYLVAQMVKNLPAMQKTWVRSGRPPQRRGWQPTPVFLPGESHGQRSLVGYSKWVTKRWT